MDIRVAGDRVDRDDPLVRRRVGQPQAADDVADRIDVRLAGPHLVVDLDDAPLDLGLRRLEPDILDVRGPAGRHEQRLRGDLLRGLALRADLEPDALLVDLDRRRVEPGVGHDPDAPLA